MFARALHQTLRLQDECGSESKELGANEDKTRWQERMEERGGEGDREETFILITSPWRLSPMPPSSSVTSSSHPLIFHCFSSSRPCATPVDPAWFPSTALSPSSRLASALGLSFIVS